MHVIHAAFPVDPERRDEAVDLAREVAAASREEPGVLEYRVAVDVDDRNLLRFVERYEDEAAYEVHADTDHFRRFKPAFSEVLAGKPEVDRFEAEAGADVEL